MKSALLKKDTLNQLVSGSIDTFDILITDDPHLDFILLNDSIANFYHLQQGEAVAKKSQYQKGEFVFIKESVHTTLQTCKYVMKIKKVQVIKENNNVFFRYKVKICKKN